MHYRNGREAKNGDKIVGMLSGKVERDKGEEVTVRRSFCKFTEQVDNA